MTGAGFFGRLTATIITIGVAVGVAAAFAGKFATHEGHLLPFGVATIWVVGIGAGISLTLALICVYWEN